MKTKLFVVLISALSLVGTQTFAQLKIGYTNIDVVLNGMPESKQIETQLKATQAQYEKLYQEKVKDFQEKLDAYEKLPANTSDIIKADKEKQLQGLQQSIQEFQKNSQEDLQKKQAQLLQPVLQKIQTAIDAVAKENSYNYILNTAADASGMPYMLYADEQFNITNMVFKKLGIEPPKQEAPKPATPASNTAQPKKN